MIGGGQGDETGFLNEFIDDMAWISSTMLHMTEATGDDTYFNMAKKIYDTHMVTRARKMRKVGRCHGKRLVPLIRILVIFVRMLRLVL